MIVSLVSVLIVGTTRNVNVVRTAPVSTSNVARLIHFCLDVDQAITHVERESVFAPIWSFGQHAAACHQHQNRVDLCRTTQSFGSHENLGIEIRV